MRSVRRDRADARAKKRLIDCFCSSPRPANTMLSHDHQAYFRAFGRYLAQLRKLRGFTQAELAGAPLESPSGPSSRMSGASGA